MDEKVAQLIEALTETVRAMNESTVGDRGDHPGNLRDAFKKTDAQVTTDSNKDLAELNAEENSKARKKEEEAKGRKIMKNVMPINVMSFDQKALKQLAGISPTVRKAKDEVEKPKVEKDSALLSLLKGLAYTAFAAIVGPVMVLFGFFDEIGKQKWFIKLKEFLKRKFWEPIKRFFRPVVKFFTRVKNSKFVKTISKYVDDAWKGIKSFGRRVRSFVKPVTDFITRMKNSKFVTTLTNMFTRIGGFMGGSGGKPSVFGKILNFFNPAKNKVLSGIIRFAKGLGATLGKLFLPLTIIMGVVDGVMGFMKGYEEKGDLLGGIEGALTGIINGLIMLPLDLLKDGLSWILDLVGLEGASAWLDSFSFQDLFGEWMDTIFCNIRKMWDNLTGGFTDIWDAFFGEGDGIDWEKLFKGLMTVVTTIPAYIIDTIKDGISMMLGWFGVDTAWLDSFDVMDIVNETIDWFIGGITGIVDWFKLLFTEPEKAFKKIGDWFGKLFKDPIGTIKDMLPQWVIDFGSWIYDKAIKPISDFFSGLTSDPEGTKSAFLNMLPSWLTGFGGWVYDSFIYPIVLFFDNLLKGDLIGAFSALVPQWLKDFGGWLYDETIGKIASFFSGMEEDSEGMKEAFLGMLPDWLKGFGTWLWDNGIKPISDWFSKLFDDPIGAFMDLIPDWVKDVGGWIGDQLSGVWTGITDLFDPILNFDFTSLIPDWIMDFIDDDEKEAFAAAQNKEAAKTAENLAKSGMGADAAETVAQARLEARDTRGGQNLADDADKYVDRLEDMIANNKQLSNTHNESIIRAMEHGGHGFKSSLFAQEVYKKTGGAFDSSNKEHRSILKRHLAQVKDSSEWDTSDQMKDKYDESMRLLGLAAAQNEYAMGVETDTVNAAVSALKKTGGLQLGDETLRFYDTSPITGTMIASIQEMFNDKSDDKKIMVAALKKIGITPENLAKSSRFKASEDVAQDFIWRPGEQPMKFSRGDVVVGMHESTIQPQASSSPANEKLNIELINRVDQMVNTLTENKDIQAKMLEALVESGIMDKQGNTVVNNGGNSTVVNNNTVESNIMSFRDRVSGRLNDGTTKY